MCLHVGAPQIMLLHELQAKASETTRPASIHETENMVHELLFQILANAKMLQLQVCAHEEGTERASMEVAVHLGREKNCAA